MGKLTAGTLVRDKQRLFFRGIGVISAIPHWAKGWLIVEIEEGRYPVDIQENELEVVSTNISLEELL
jgi:hypothetical protein